MVAVGDEADLVAVRLLRDRQAERAGVLADRRLLEAADRKHRVGELRLRQREEEVRLILGRIGAAQEPILAGRGIPLDAGVMAGGDEVGVERLGPRRQRRELQVAVAVHAGNRRAAAGVLAHEVRDHLLGELPLEIDDVVGDADAPGHTPGVVQVVDRAAGAEADFSLALVVQLHRQTDHLVALLREERRSDGGVDAAGHGYDDSHGFKKS